MEILRKPRFSRAQATSTRTHTLLDQRRTTRNGHDTSARLAQRQAFPLDRESYFYRPLNLLGICIGAWHCPALTDVDRKWLPTGAVRWARHDSRNIHARTTLVQSQQHNSGSRGTMHSTQLRRSRKVIHFCSIKVTHLENRSRFQRASSSTQQACAVVAKMPDSISSAPKARSARVEGGSKRTALSRWRGTAEFVAEVLEVFRANLECSTSSITGAKYASERIVPRGDSIDRSR